MHVINNAPTKSREHQSLNAFNLSNSTSKMGIKAGYCAVCQAKGKRRHTYHMKRKALSELSGNSRRLHTPRTTFGCLICGVFICKKGVAGSHIWLKWLK